MVFTSFYNAKELPFDEAQALRYFGYRNGNLPSAQVKELFSSCKEEVFSAVEGKVCYSVFPVKEENGVLDLGFLKTDSASLKRNLSGAEFIVAFAATVGIGVDRLIHKYSALAQDKAYACQALGAERIEALCDRFNGEIVEKYRAEGYFARPRFSCGYGDFPLEKQRDFISALDTARKIGVTLGDSLLMSPSKSVTAVIGFSKTECKPLGDKCLACTKENCEFRK